METMSAIVIRGRCERRQGRGGRWIYIKCARPARGRVIVPCETWARSPVGMCTVAINRDLISNPPLVPSFLQLHFLLSCPLSPRTRYERRTISLRPVPLVLPNLRFKSRLFSLPLAFSIRFPSIPPTSLRAPVILIPDRMNSSALVGIPPCIFLVPAEPCSFPQLSQTGVFLSSFSTSLSPASTSMLGLDAT